MDLTAHDLPDDDAQIIRPIIPSRDLATPLKIGAYSTIAERR